MIMVQQVASVLVFLTLILPDGMSQGHEPVFPELEGFDLELAVRQTYRPTELMEYGEARDTLYKIVEAENDSVYGIYTNHAVYLPPDENPRQAIFKDGAADGINAEHTWPRSKGSRDNLGERDMHHLRPSKVSVNADRANFPFSALSEADVVRWYFRDTELTQPPFDDTRYSKLGPELFEPRDEVKGDIARGMMYFYTVYRPEAQGADPEFFNIQRETFCRWHLEDPVDESEWERTHTIATYQENKANPFVLDCTLAHRMYCDAFDVCTPSSSTNDPIIQGSVQIFPTPAGDQVTLKAKNLVFQGGTWKIYSAQGQLMREMNATSPQHTLIISDWPSGMYWVHWIPSDNAEPIITQFVKS